MKKQKALAGYLKSFVVLIPFLITLTLLVSDIALDIFHLKRDIREHTIAYVQSVRASLERDVRYVESVFGFIRTTMVGHDESEQQAAAVRYLESMDTLHRGYYFSTDYDGWVQFGPARGRNMIDIQDKNGLYVVRELIKTARKGGGFVSYTMPPVDNAAEVPKLSYVVGVECWNWYLGAGVLLTEIEKLNRELTARQMTDTRNKVVSLLALSLLCSLLVFWYNRRSYSNILKNLSTLTDHLSQAAREVVVLPPDSLNISEFQIIAAFADRMIEERARNEEFRVRVFESSHVPIVVMDALTLIYLECNPAAVALYHMASKDDVIGLGPLDFSAPEQYDGTISEKKAMLYIDAAIAKGSVVFDWRYRYPDGEYWDSEVHLLCFTVGGRKLLQFSVIDITERKRAEIALKESNDKLNALFTAMTEMVVLHEVILDAEGKPVNYRITDCNPAYTAVTGITREQAMGRLANEVYGTDEPPYLEEFTTVGLTGVPYQYETYFPPMDKHFSISVVSPGPNKFATITTDITAVKQIQQVIEAKNRELEQIVYVTSHDLRSPLVNVDGYSREIEYAIADLKELLGKPDLNLATLSEKLEAELGEMIKASTYIRNSTRQMDNLLKGLLKLSRLGRAALEIVSLDMNALVAQVRASLAYQIQSQKAEVEISDLPPCRADAVQVTQVFSNLIGNALKYADPLRAARIRISGTVDNRKAVYCVEDNGIGIAAEHLDTVFKLFHRLAPGKTEGEGVGLTIVKNILTRLEGSVRVESTPGAGSRFYVTLPLGKEQGRGK